MFKRTYTDFIVCKSGWLSRDQFDRMTPSPLIAYQPSSHNMNRMDNPAAPSAMPHQMAYHQAGQIHREFQIAYRETAMYQQQMMQIEPVSFNPQYLMRHNTAMRYM